VNAIGVPEEPEGLALDDFKQDTVGDIFDDGGYRYGVTLQVEFQIIFLSC
jgi:hypothetical protein